VGAIKVRCRAPQRREAAEERKEKEVEHGHCVAHLQLFVFLTRNNFKEPQMTQVKMDAFIRHP
jgi:hypothetical protein